MMKRTLACSSRVALTSMLLGAVGCTTTVRGATTCGVTTLASAPLGGAPAIALHGDALFWADDDGGSVIRTVPLDGSAPTVVASVDDLTLALAADATTLYLAGDQGVEKMPASGGPATRLLALSPSTWASQIAVDAESVYTLAYDPFHALTAHLTKTPLSGGPSSEIATWPVRDGRQTFFTMDTDAVYWTNTVEGTVMKAPKAGGAPVTIASGQGVPEEIAVDADSVYWVGWDDPHGESTWVAKVSKTGGLPTILASGQGSYDLVVDTTGVYWGEGDDLVRIPLGGGTPEVLTSLGDGGGFGMIACPRGVCWLAIPVVDPTAGKDPTTYSVVRWQACD
jgi:hypothetical protein